MEIKKGSASYWILFCLEKAVDGYVRFENYTYHNYRYLYGIPELKKPALAAALKRLREKGFVAEEKSNTGEIILKLTDEGKTIFLLEGEEKKEWDGKWRIVVFDIPEQKRLIRNLFRRNLKKWGFKQLQKSVWISKKDVIDKLLEYIRDLGVEKWVWVFESEKYGPVNIHLDDRHKVR